MVAAPRAWPEQDAPVLGQVVSSASSGEGDQHHWLQWQDQGLKNRKTMLRANPSRRDEE